MSVAKLEKEFAIFNVPNGDPAIVISTDDRLELLNIVEDESNWVLVGGLDLLLSMEVPGIDLPRSK